MSAVVRYREGDSTALGLVTADDHIVPLKQRSWAELFESDSGPQPREGADAVSGVDVLCPVVRPGKVLCTGVNYPSHKDENPTAVLPEVPFFFSKLPSAVVGPGELISMPVPSTELDYEVELAVLIGRRAKGLSLDNALDVVWGYTVMNDVSARDVQFTDNQITLGKGFDGFCPLGPCVVPASEIPDPQALVVRSWVNGELRQQEPTANMLFSVADLLVFVSRFITLEPGDVVTTGTPAGVGYFMKPKGLLQPGDVVEVEVEGIGRLSNTVVAGW
jgi:2-keto-4-pentenoate hydratase/2-oxohepta-3-ene-1,7-dioic acid hydratase in catechol pathway